MARASNGTKAKSAENRLKALQLRQIGFTYAEIGNALGISAQASHKHVAKALAEIHAKTEETAAEIITMEITRLDGYLKAMSNQLTRGDPTAIEKALKIGERRAKLLGLDAPTKVAPTNPGGDQPYSDPAAMSPEERRARIAELESRRRGADGA